MFVWPFIALDEESEDLIPNDIKDDFELFLAVILNPYCVIPCLDTKLEYYSYCFDDLSELWLKNLCFDL